MTEEVDILTAPDLVAIVNAIIDGSHRPVVLDLSKCTFVVASSLESWPPVALLRLPTLSGVVTVRSPPAMVLRILTVNGVDQIVAIEQVVSPARHLRREPAARGLATGATISADTGTKSPRQVIAMHAARGVVGGASRLVVALARATLQRADRVSVMLRHGRLSTVTSHRPDHLGRGRRLMRLPAKVPVWTPRSTGGWFRNRSSRRRNLMASRRRALCGTLEVPQLLGRTTSAS